MKTSIFYVMAFRFLAMSRASGHQHFTRANVQHTAGEIKCTMVFGAAGFSGWFSPLILEPLVNLIILYFVAFSEWSSLRITNNTRGTNPSSE